MNLVKRLREALFSDHEDLDLGIEAADRLEAAEKLIEQLESALTHILVGSLSLPRFAEEQGREALAAAKAWKEGV